MDWLLKSVIPKASWPKITFKPKRAMTADEHRRIVERARNQEGRAFYQMCWHLGGSQTDAACLTSDNVDWKIHTICYPQQKLKNQPKTSGSARACWIATPRVRRRFHPLLDIRPGRLGADLQKARHGQGLRNSKPL